MLIKNLIRSKEDTDTFYVYCQENSGTEKICSKMRFLPIIRTKPAFKNCVSSLMMGYSKK